MPTAPATAATSAVSVGETPSRYPAATPAKAVCHRCGGPATTTQRLVDGRPAPYSGETVLVGAAEQYEARCRGCHEAGVDAAALVAA